MQRDDLYMPSDFASVDGKLRVVDDSIDHLLNAIDRAANADDTDDALVELMADMSAALVAIHMVVASMLQDQQQCT
jgi:hypothetical protein